MKWFVSDKAFRREVEAEAEKRETEAQRREREWKERQRAMEEEYRERVRICDQIAREQIRQAKELEQHEKKLAQHDEQIAKLEYRMDQAEADIEHWKEQLGSLYQLLSIEEDEQVNAVPGSKTDIKCQKRIIALRNQIHAAESRYSKAKFEREQAQIKLSS